MKERYFFTLVSYFFPCVCDVGVCAVGMCAVGVCAVVVCAVVVLLVCFVVVLCHCHVVYGCCYWWHFDAVLCCNGWTDPWMIILSFLVVVVL
jgi:hypothetical protein